MRKMQSIQLAALLALVGASPAMADVLPSSQQVAGYSLATAAQATAVYNTGIQAGNPDTPPPPSLPFDVVVGNTVESQGTYIYLPIFADDNSGGVDPNFPSDISNQTADAEYLGQYVYNNYGVTSFIVQINGNTTTLDDSYITGVNTPTLLDGTPGGNEYISSSAFLSPLPMGDNTINIGGLIGGQPAVFLSYDVDVVPEPASLGMLAMLGCGLLARRTDF